MEKKNISFSRLQNTITH